MRKQILAACILAMMIGCQPPDERAENDKLLVKVHNKSLYLSELEGMIPEDSSVEDSSMIVNGFVERWVKEAVLLHEAERNISQDLNIDKLVRDYRASLIKHNYEKTLVEEMLDSTITQAELTDFYEKNKDQYQLQTPIVRCYFLKVPLDAPERSELRTHWEGSNSSADSYNRLIEYANLYAVAHLLEDSTWYKVDEIADELPPNTLTANNVNSKKDFVQRDDNFEYYFKALEVISRQEIAPLSYIETQARKFILRQRKLKLMERLKENMYEKALRRNEITLYNE